MKIYLKMFTLIGFKPGPSAKANGIQKRCEREGEQNNPNICQESNPACPMCIQSLYYLFLNALVGHWAVF